MSGSNPAHAGDQDRLGPFTAIAAKAIGAPHSQSGDPCQDSYSMLISTEPRPVFIAVVADGISNSSGSERASHLCAVRTVALIYEKIESLIHTSPDEWESFAEALLKSLSEELRAMDYSRDTEMHLASSGSAKLDSTPATTLSVAFGALEQAVCTVRWLAIGNSPIIAHDTMRGSAIWLHTASVEGHATPSIPHAKNATASGIIVLPTSSQIVLATDGLDKILKSAGALEGLNTLSRRAAAGYSVGPDLIEFANQRRQGENDDRAFVLASWRN
ncbi:MAG TPA: protein phosphatase 2C domain-containing protein [Bacillota bacterium]|nr:protein phosphatase 2C domain-containing protein [Bacillota bacterium]